MITYEETLAWLYAHADEGYRVFHKKLLKNEAINVIGVRMPALRKFAKDQKDDFNEIVSFSDEYYEVTFLKCAVAASLPFEEFCGVVDSLVPLLDNWATCDCFKASCIAKHRDEFVPFLKRYLGDKREFVRRYGLVTLLHFYVDEKHLPLIFKSAVGGEEPYYVMMARAWLIAEVLVKFYDAGIAFLREGNLSRETHNTAIKKARESFRLTAEQKAELAGMKK